MFLSEIIYSFFFLAKKNALSGSLAFQLCDEWGSSLADSWLGLMDEFLFDNGRLLYRQEKSGQGQGN